MKEISQLSIIKVSILLLIIQTMCLSAYAQKVEKLFNEKKYAEALVLYQKKAKRNSFISYYWQQVAICYYNLDSVENALRALNKAIDLGHIETELLLLAAINSRLGNNEEALSHIQSVIYLNEGKGSTSFKFQGDILLDMKRYEGAIFSFESALKLCPSNNDSIYILRGIETAHYNLGNYLQALTTLYKVMETDSTNHDTYYFKLGILCNLMGKFELAKDFLTSANSLKPNDALIQAELAYTEQKLQNFERSIELINSSLMLDSTNYKSHLIVAIILFEQDMIETSRNSFEKGKRIIEKKNYESCDYIIPKEIEIYFEKINDL